MRQRGQLTLAAAFAGPVTFGGTGHRVEIRGDDVY